MPPHQYVFPQAEFFLRVSSDDDDDDIMRSDLDQTGTTESSLQDSDVIDVTTDDENPSSSRNPETERTDPDNSIVVDFNTEVKPDDVKSQETDGDNSGVK